MFCVRESHATKRRPSYIYTHTAGAHPPAGGGHSHRHRRRKRLLLLFKKAAGQQNAAAAGPQINSRPVITRARTRPFRPCKNIMIKTTTTTAERISQ